MRKRLPTALFAIIGLLICCVSIARSQEAPPERVRVGEDAMRAVLVKKVAPIYPPLARQARIQGTVILRIVIDKSGNVFSVQLVSGHPMLSPAAMEAVRQWKYEPYLVNGEPVEVETNVQVNFKLEGEPASANPPESAPGTGPGEVPGGIPGATPGQNVRFGVVGGVIAPATASDSSHPALPKRVRVSSGVSQGLLQRKVSPTYPPDARQQRIQGVVVLKVEIDKDGNVYDVELISGHPLLAPTAIDAVRLWKYKPYLLNGEPVAIETQVQVNFTLM